MKRHWQWRLTHLVNKADTMMFRSDERFRLMLERLTRDGEVDEYKRERVLVLR